MYIYIIYMCIYNIVGTTSYYTYVLQRTELFSSFVECERIIIIVNETQKNHQITQQVTIEAGYANLTHILPISELITEYLSVLQFLVYWQDFKKGNDQALTSSGRMYSQLFLGWFTVRARYSSVLETKNDAYFAETEIGWDKHTLLLFRDKLDLLFYIFS